MLKKIWKYLSNPKTKAIITLSSTIIFGLLTKAIVNWATINDDVHWLLMTHYYVTYILLAYFALFGIYILFTTKAEIKLREKFDDAFFKQVVLESGLPAIAEKIKDAISNGDKEKVKQYIEISDLLKNNFQ